MQPLIFYTITASMVLGQSGSITSSVEYNSVKQIQLIPRYGPLPPTAIDDFPADFIPHCQKQVRRGPWRRRLGFISVSTVEPPPIILGSVATKEILSCINITFTPYFPHTAGIDWQFLRCRLKSQLQINTFYSTRRMTQMPERSKSSNPTLRFKTEFVQLEGQELTASRKTTNHSCGPPFKFDFEMSASIPLPSLQSTEILPTFIHRYAARLYSLSMVIVLPDISHGSFELEVPIQMVYESQTPGRVL